MRKRFLFFLLPALLLVGSFVAVQIVLRRSIKKDENRSGNTANTVDTLGGKKTTAADLRPLLLAKLQQIISKSSDGLYQLETGDLQIDVLASQIILRDFSLVPVASAMSEQKRAGRLPPTVVSLKAKAFLIEGVNLDDVLTRKTIDFKRIRLQNPVVSLESFKVKRKNGNGAFTERFLQQLQRLRIDDLAIENASVTVKNATGKRTSFQNVNFQLKDILVDSSTREDRKRFLFARTAQADINKINGQSKDGVYRYAVERVTADLVVGKVTMKGLTYFTPLDRAVFAAKKGSKEMYELRLPELNAEGIDAFAALNEEGFHAEQITASGGSVRIFFDRSLKPIPRTGKFPNQLLAAAPVPLRINTVLLRNFRLTYAEFNPRSGKQGELLFTNVNVQVSNIDNQARRGAMLAKMDARLLDQLPVHGSFRFDLANAKHGSFSASLSAGEVDATRLNPVMMPLGMMEVEKGRLKKLEATITGNENAATGQVLAAYEDLKIAVLEKEENKTLDKKNVTSLFANLFVLKKDNPKNGQPVRAEGTAFQRDPNGGFMNLVWKTTLVGLLKAMGAPAKLAKGRK